MTLEQARRILKRDGTYGELLNAIGTLAEASTSTYDDLLLGLRYPGVVADQAALALYHRTGRTIPRDPARFVTDLGTWSERVRRKRREAATPQRTTSVGRTRRASVKRG